MKHQIITSPSGDELVVLSRRDYDALLARLGDEEAEDRMTERLVAESRQAVEQRRETVLPAWLAEAVARGEPALRAARRHRGVTLAQLSAHTGVSQDALGDIEHGRAHGDGDALGRIAAALAVSPEWLQD